MCATAGEPDRQVCAADARQSTCQRGRSPRPPRDAASVTLTQMSKNALSLFAHFRSFFVHSQPAKKETWRVTRRLLSTCQVSAVTHTHTHTCIYHTWHLRCERLFMWVCVCFCCCSFHCLLTHSFFVLLCVCVFLCVWLAQVCHVFRFVSRVWRVCVCACRPARCVVQIRPVCVYVCLCV